MAGEEEVGARDHFFGNLQRQEELIKRDGHQSVSGQHWIFASALWLHLEVLYLCMMMDGIYS